MNHNPEVESHYGSSQKLRRYQPVTYSSASSATGKVVYASELPSEVHLEIRLPDPRPPDHRSVEALRCPGAGGAPTGMLGLTTTSLLTLLSILPNIPSRSRPFPSPCSVATW
jgi:hypothetical protein